MEQTWYLFPGQVLESTKIKDRGKALIATKGAWKSITDHLHRKQFQQEILDEEEERKHYMKEGSEKMTETWTNSFKKIQERRMRDLTMKAKIKEENLVKRYMELRAEQQAEREIILSQLSKKLYMTTEKPRELNSALLTSEVLFERNIQVGFNKMVREHEQIEILKEAKAIKYNAEQEVIENNTKAKSRRATDIQHGKELMEQINEIEANAKKAKEEKVRQEIIDIERGKEEYAAIKKFEFEEEKKRKADVKKQFNDFSIVQKEIAAENERQDKIQDKIIKIYERGKCRIDEKRKATTQTALAEEIRIRSKIAEKVMSVQMSREGEENERIANSIKSKMESEDQMNAKKAKYQEKLKKEKDEYRIYIQKRKAKEAHDKNEIKKWEMMNRIKSKEVLDKYNLDKLQKLFDKKIKYRHELDKQMKEIDKTDYNKQCYDAEMKEIRDKLESEDALFFDYAQEVYDLIKSRGRSTKPVEKMIEKYKKENKLIHRPGLPTVKDKRDLVSSVPIGGVKLDDAKKEEKTGKNAKKEKEKECNCE